MRKILFFLPLISYMSAWAASVPAEDSLFKQSRLNYKEINFLGNIYDGSHNPAALSFNKVQTLSEATLNARLERGGFQNVTSSSRLNHYSLDIFGLKQIGDFSLSGNIKYLNAKDYDHQWDNTYMLNPDNPFTLGDTIKSDMNTEEFSLHVGAAYRANDALVLGLRINFVSGSRSDQHDPRPKTNSMRFGVNPGAILRLSDSHSLGLSANVDLFNSKMTHTIVNTYLRYQYFLMKGMGDNTTFSTETNSSYPRDYNGLNLGGHLQWNAKWDGFNNMLELGGTYIQENAKDGGSSYTYKGGDFHQINLDATDRLSLGTHRLKHNIILTGVFSKTQGDWYDQMRKVDTQHGNIVYYEVLSKDKVHDATRLNAGVEYRIDALEAPDVPLWTARVKGNMSYTEITQTESEVYKQKYTLANVLAEGLKYWQLSRLRLTTALGGSYTMPLGDPEFASVRGKLLENYTAPVFEYATAKAAQVHGRLALDIPVSLWNTPTWMTVYAQAACRFYNGDTKYSSLYDGKSHTTADFGIRIIL